MLGSELTLEQSVRSPETFKRTLLTHLGEVSTYGAQVWEQTHAHGLVSLDRLTFDPSSWSSASDERGNITLGTKPMERSWKQRLLFCDEEFSYRDELAYRFLHEVNHSFGYLTYPTPSVQTLYNAAFQTRAAMQDDQGLSAIGSLDHYRGEAKVKEDTVELLTMYAWDPNYCADYIGYLVDGDRAEKRALGLVTLGSTGLYPLVANAIECNLA